ncbi:MAG: hypothetical protein F6J87_22880 [Spirulina sp. SIO3F2]|nr:hypothetical protein [Spirulina sp. SIO3F2]
MTMQIKSFLGLAGLASLSLALAAPHAQAQSQAPLLLADGHLCGDGYSFSTEGFDPITAENIAYDLACDGLSYDASFICTNNPSENCGEDPYVVPDNHKIPDAEYDNGGAPSGFACLNNVNPACDNFRHYGVLYTEYEPEVTSRTDAVFAQLGQSSPAVTLPPRTTAAPAPAPIQGLW